jgi:16S rRNA (cytosine1402-N4)-methyltransferase
MLAAVAPADGMVVVDGTFGTGGYSRALLDAAKLRAVGLDRDPDAVGLGHALAERNPRFAMVHATFGDLAAALARLGLEAVDAVVLDLGVSSMQLGTAARGFSFQEDGPLDMRMDPGSGASAADLIETLPERELARLLARYGEEPSARRIARAIVEARRSGAITRTLELAELVARVTRAGGPVHPATRTFQALRIAVNDELGELERGLADAERCLRPGGRLVVVSFHSLEDRIVKRFLIERSRPAARPSRHLPDRTDAQRAQTFRMLTRRPIRPGEAELRRNPRARSARLRSAERLASAAVAGQEEEVRAA